MHVNVPEWVLVELRKLENFLIFGLMDEENEAVKGVTDEEVFNLIPAQV